MLTQERNTNSSDFAFGPGVLPDGQPMPVKVSLTEAQAIAFGEQTIIYFGGFGIFKVNHDVGLPTIGPVRYVRIEDPTYQNEFDLRVETKVSRITHLKGFLLGEPLKTEMTVNKATKKLKYPSKN